MSLYSKALGIGVWDVRLEPGSFSHYEPADRKLEDAIRIAVMSVGKKRCIAPIVFPIFSNEQDHKEYLKRLRARADAAYHQMQADVGGPDHGEQ
jgi:hypothetical protein